MKRYLLAVVGLFVSLLSMGQNPVQWKFEAKKIADKTYEIRMHATVPSPWHIYSQTTPEGGPLPTKISFIKNPLLELQGGPAEKGKLIKKFEDVFEVNVMYFDREVEFVQVVKVKSKVKTNIRGAVEFMVCNDTQCLPPSEVPFTIELK